MQARPICRVGAYCRVAEFDPLHIVRLLVIRLGFDAVKDVSEPILFWGDHLHFGVKFVPDALHILLSHSFTKENDFSFGT